jgi:seryl-tRNA synthetase
MSDAAFVLDRLRRQQQKYREMVGLSAEPKDVDALLAMIERKRSILAEIDALEAELAPLKTDWAKTRASFSPEEARQVRETLDATQQVLQELVKVEDKGRASMEQRKSLDHLMQTSRARGAYGAR